MISMLIPWSMPYPIGSPDLCPKHMAAYAKWEPGEVWRVDWEDSSEIQRGGTGCTKCAHLRMKLPIRSELLIRHEVSITRTKNTYKKDLEILFIRRNRNELGLIPPNSLVHSIWHQRIWPPSRSPSRPTRCPGARDHRGLGPGRKWEESSVSQPLILIHV